MIINLHRQYKNATEFSNSIVEYLKQGYSLICVWLQDEEPEYIIPPKLNPICYMGYYIYGYDEDNNLLQIREEISKKLNGAIEHDELATQSSLVDERTFKNMLYNAFPGIKNYKNTYNPLIGEYVDDFFIQWSLEPEEPDRIILVEPHENYLNKTFDKKSASIISEYLLNWANKYPHYSINLSFEYRIKIDRFNYMKKLGFSQEITDYLYCEIPELFIRNENYLYRYLMILKAKLGNDFVKIINKLYIENHTKFANLFSVECINRELF